MELDATSVMVGIGIGAAGLVIGYTRRYQSHQLSIRRDLLFLATTVVGFFSIIVVGTGFAAELVFIFMLFYILSYRMADPRDWTGISTYSEDLLESVDRELVHYIKDGVQYTTDQNIRSAIKNVLGIRDTLDADFSSIRRVRTSSFSKKGRKPKKMLVAAVSFYNIEPVMRGRIRIGTKKTVDDDGNLTRVPRYLTDLQVYHHEVHFADCATTDPITFDTSVDVRDEIIKLYIGEQQKNRRLEVQNRGLRYEGAAEIIEGIFDLDLDSQGIENETLQELAEEMRRRRNISATAAKLATMKMEVNTDAGDEDDKESIAVP